MMKQGKTIVDLAKELQSIRDHGRDFVVSSGKIEAFSDAGKFGLGFEVNGEGIQVGLNSWTHGQLATYSDIPKAYYDRIKNENAELLARNVNHALATKGEDRRMLRSNGANLRALVSPKYRRLDGADLMDAVLPSLLESKMQVVSSDITEQRLYLRATTEALKADIKVGDTVQAGIMISNSDVGGGALKVQPFIVRLLCLNGMVSDHALKKAHLGRSLSIGDESIELLTDETIRLGEAAFWAEVKDVVKACLSPEMFAREVERMKAATEKKITNFDLQEVVELTCRHLNLGATKDTKNSIVEALASGNEGAGLTKWGLANSLTAVAGIESLTFDSAVELERAGSMILDLSDKEWRVIAEKKAA